MTKKINTFLVGAQKAGTTTLHSWLSQHPEIDAPLTKDLHFFTSSEYLSKGYSWYESLYKKKHFNIKLDSGANYIFRQDAAQNIFSYNPQAKILLILRDPAKRAYSAHQFFQRIGKEKREFEAAIRDEQAGKLKTQKEKDDFGYLEHGFYHQQLTKWLKYFPQKQIFILIYEEFFKHPEQSLKEVFSFLELENKDFEVRLSSKNIAGTVKYKNLNSLIYNNDSFLRKVLNKTNAKHIFPIRWRAKLLGGFRDWNTKKGEPTKRITPNLYSELSDLFKDDTDQLSKFLNKDLKQLWKY